MTFEITADNCILNHCSFYKVKLKNAHFISSHFEEADFTEADLTLLRHRTGYKGKMTSIEDGIADYIKNYLATHDPYL